MPIIASPIFLETSTAGFLNVGPGSNPPAALPDATKGTVAGVWGFVGPLVEAPQQASSPPVTCGVFGQSGLPLAVSAPPLASFAGVVGFAGSGVGVYGTGSSYGVYGTSTGNVAGICGTNGFGITAPITAPGVYAQSTSLAPGILAISGNARIMSSSLSLTLDEFAAQFGSQYPNNAGLFIGGVAVTGGVVIGNNPTAATDIGCLTAQGNVDVSGHAHVNGNLNVHGNHAVGGNANVDGNHTVGGHAHVNGNLNVHGNHAVGGNATVDGNHTVGGNVSASNVMLTGGDCAERFDLGALATAEAGTVMVISEDGALRPSDRSYDRRVAGVVSGAGAFRPGIVLDKRANDEGRTTIALVGKVYCKVDADSAPISVGDLLTTSATSGHAMKAVDPMKAFGAVIGKALGNLDEGFGLIPILVAMA